MTQPTAPQPMYTTVDSVKVRLAGKVQFQSSETGPADGELPDLLLLQLIRDAETLVEQDLRVRYMIPFQSIRTGRFSDLPDHSRAALRMQCDLKAVLLVLGTDFGRGTHVGADPYAKFTSGQYKEGLMRLLGHDAEGKLTERYFRTPPLEDVRLAATNLATADNGFRGKIINTDASRHDSASYAARQINDPSRTYVKKPTVGGI